MTHYGRHAPRCARPMKIVSLIDSHAAMERILRHLKLWERPARPPPQRTAFYEIDYAADDTRRLYLR